MVCRPFAWEKIKVKRHLAPSARAQTEGGIPRIAPIELVVSWPSLADIGGNPGELTTTVLLHLALEYSGLSLQHFRTNLLIFDKLFTNVHFTCTIKLGASTTLQT